MICKKQSKGLDETGSEHYESNAFHETHNELQYLFQY